MKSEWADHDAEAVVARYPDVARDLALRVYTTRLLGRDPIAVRVDGVTVALRRREAMAIIVTPAAEP